MNRAFAENVKKHFTVIDRGEKRKNGSGKWKCNYCPKEMTGTATRLLAHLLKISQEGTKDCKGVPEALQIELRYAASRRTDDGKFAGGKVASKRHKSGTPTRGAATKPEPLIDAWQQQGTDADGRTAAADAAVTQMFIDNGVPFKVARSASWKKMVKVIGDQGGTYVSPTRKRLAGKLLAGARQRVEKMLQGWEKEGVQKTGFVLQSESFEDSSGRPLIITVLSTPKGAKFISTKDCTGVEIDADFIFGLWMEAISNVGPENVSAIVSDSAPVNVTAAKKVKDAFPHIFWVHCTTHALDLVLQDIGNISPFPTTLSSVRRLINFFTRFRTVGDTFPPNLHLKSPDPSRFFTEFLAADRLSELKATLKVVVNNHEFVTWANKPSHREEAAWALSMVENEEFWGEVSLMVEVSKPIVELLKMVDADMGTMGKVYHHVHTLEPRLDKMKSKSFTDEVKRAVRGVLKETLAGFVSPLHRAAYALDPEFQDNRKGTKFIEALEEVCKAILPKEEWSRALLGLSAFNNKAGKFGRHVAGDVAAHEWWDRVGGEWPELQKVAVRVLAMVSGAGACERGWTSDDVIHSEEKRRRDGLNAKRAEDLVFVFYNNRLMEKPRGPQKLLKWGEGGTDSEEDDLLVCEGEEEEESEKGEGEEEGEEGEEGEDAMEEEEEEEVEEDQHWYSSENE